MKILKLLIFAFFILECLNSRKCREETNLSYHNQNDSLIHTHRERLIKNCVNSNFRNTTNGQILCANYSEDTNTSFNFNDQNCTLLYWHCCESLEKEGMQGEGNKTCTLIKKCSNYYSVNTCVTPSTCAANGTCSNEVSNLFDNSSDSTTPNDIRDLQKLQNTDQGFVNLAQKEWIQSTLCVGKKINNMMNAGKLNCCSQCEIQNYTLNGNLVFKYEIPNLNESNISPILVASNVSASFRQTALKNKIMFLEL